jgi:hypothetical protein
MAGFDCRTDSRELDLLRFRFKSAHPGLRATPERLAAFARERNYIITDMGRHSKRWIARFTEPVIQPLT